MAPALVLALLIGAYAAVAGSLALRRHAHLETQALDMGYADQIAWNMAHGRWFRFTVFRGDVGSEFGLALSYGPGADRDSLFAYHVELLYLPIALLYLVRPGPETLIALLTGVLALGALPAYWIARRRLAHRGAALAFAALYLASPSIQAANLSDFHPVSMSGPLLLFALHFLLAGRYRAFAALAVVCAVAKEEVGLLVGMTGLYAWLALGQRRLGLAVAALSFAWVGLCFGAIIPHFTGGAPSLFVVRYGDALALWRAFWSEAAAGRLLPPVPEFTVRHVAHLLASTGFLAVFGPRELAIAVPTLAINGLSGSTWQHGGGAHYSSETVAPLILAAIAGAGRLARWTAQAGSFSDTKRGDDGRGDTRLRAGGVWGHAALVVSAAGLALALVETHREGILPPARRFTWPAASAHAARLPPLLALIPPDAVVSAQSNVYPHLSNRTRIYPFPTIDDAEYVLVDVAGTSSPQRPDELAVAARSVLADPEFALVAGDDGFLLFRRRGGAHGGPSGPGVGATPESVPSVPAEARLPRDFFSFVWAAGGEHYTPARATFEDAIDLVGFRVAPLLEVNFSERRVVPELYFRARRALERRYRLTTYLVGRDGVARRHDNGNSAQLWYPTDRWQPGEVIRVRYPPATYSQGDRLGLGVQLGSGPDALRLRAASADVPILDAGHVPVLAALP